MPGSVISVWMKVHSDVWNLNGTDPETSIERYETVVKKGRAAVYLSTAARLGLEMREGKLLKF